MHTLAKRCSTASAHSVSMSSAVASGLSSVWSMNRARSAGTFPAWPVYETRDAPPATTSATLGAHSPAQPPEHVPPQPSQTAWPPLAARVAITSRVIASIRAARSSVRGGHRWGSFMYRSSISVILATRLPCRSAPHEVVRKVSTISRASPSPIMRAPSVSTLA